MNRRLLVSVSPMLATAALTAAIFLLPATSDHRQARAAIDDIMTSTYHISNVSDAAARLRD